MTILTDARMADEREAKLLDSAEAERNSLIGIPFHTMNTGTMGRAVPPKRHDDTFNQYK